ncbi:uncharacterized protein A4U43_C09F8340 [Asparagus officinalis]|uniref:Protein kinase domain-containing protein n=1 Tax=Asparagus officinalis TaxID=4686 RepID=A0A5P1E660_ASPOF|nr:receptor-like kinase TMK4 [Asparagus officinalis]ONK58121.1 uncharacterized protein A4U43_C09F8340 [Asparagus officinalis]
MGKEEEEEEEKRKHFPFHPFAFVFLLIISPAIAKDGDVMSDLAKSLTNVPSDWKSGTDFCKWSGIACQGGQVTALNLAQKSLSGNLPDSINKLGSLQTVNLQRNQISGLLPSFSNLGSLQKLHLDTNAFSSLPPDFFSGLTSLQEVTLDDNPFSPWSIPDDLSKSDSLREFSASNASISGTIPDFFGVLSGLEDLRLSYNNLTGGIPLSFTGSSIKNLWLNNQQSGEKLTGRIDVIGGMNQLSLLWLQSNSFSGPIPDVSNLTSLSSFNVRDNQLTGVVPPSLTSSHSLQNASLSNNNFQGPFPAFPGGVNADVSKGNNFCTDMAGTPCDSRVNVLLSVAAGFGYPDTLARSWKGNNPCAGPWTGVVCDTQGNEILVLNFANQHFVGTISPDIANLTSLNKLLLSNNNLTGPIPDSLTGLKSLQLLDASNNDLWGKVPGFDKSVTLKLSGNPRIGTEPSPGTAGPPGSLQSVGSGSKSSPSGDGSAGKSRSSSGLIVGIVIVVVVIVGCLGGLIYYLQCRKKNTPFKPIIRAGPPKELPDTQLKIGIINGYGNNTGARNELFSQGSGEDVLSTIPIEDIRKATDNFNEANIIGQGGFGVVYKGELNGTEIAVKRSESESMGKKTGVAEFEAEVHVLQKTRHRHLVSFLGYCRDNNEKLLVYEYMPEGTLGQHLFDRDCGKYCALNWRQRLVIALDVARGIEYLHSLAQESFIHRDLKPSNILLGKDLRAKVSDFGLVKLADTEKSVMTRLAGTFGYLAPEYALTGKVSTKVDVYAFGVILMEIITGRKVLDESLAEEDSHLVVAFRRRIINKEKFLTIVDSSLVLDEKAYESILQVSELACHCTAREANQRPTMGYAVQVLSPLVDQWVPSSFQYEEDSSMSLASELEKWQSDSDSSLFATYKGSSSTSHY